MAGELERIYQDIANAINESLDGTWTRAWIIAKLEEDTAEISFKYQQSAEAPPLSFAKKIAPRSGVIYSAFEELRDIMKSSNKQPWSSAKFTLENDGNFKMDFTYD